MRRIDEQRRTEGLVKGADKRPKFSEWTRMRRKTAKHLETATLKKLNIKKKAGQTRERVSEIPRRRHWRRMPPDDMFFSASISVKLRELAKMRTSTRLMRRCKKVTEASTARP